MYFTYILKSTSTDRFYVGHSDNLLNRYRQHSNSVNLATRNRGPWVLEHFEIFPSRSEAMKREQEIKAKKSAKSIRRLIQFHLSELNLE